MKKDVSKIREIAEKSLEKLEQLDDIATLKGAIEGSEEKLEQIEISLHENVKSSLAISEEIHSLRHDMKLRAKGQPGWCQKHGHTTLIWEKEKGWHCVECISE